MINRLRKALLSQMSRTAEDATEDAVHDLRVAVRRLSEALRLFGADSHSRKRLRRIRDRAAAVRDRDVCIRLLRRPATDPVVNYVRGQRDLAAAQLIAFLHRQLRQPMERVPEQGTPQSLLPRVEVFLDADPAQAHALRIAAKRLRYAIEILNPDGAEPWLKRLRQLQRQLGDLHDLQVAGSLISAHPLAARMTTDLHARATILEARFQQQWRRSFGPRVRQRLLAWAKAET